MIEGDFVPGVATVKAKPGTDYGEFPFPSINGSAAVGRDRRRHDRRVPGHPGDRGVREVPRHARTRPRRGRRKGGFATGNKNMPASVYPDATTRATASAIAAAKNVVVRHVRPAAGLVRRDGRPGRVGALPGLPAQPVERAAGSRRSSRRRPPRRTRRASRRLEPGQRSRWSRRSRRLHRPGSGPGPAPVPAPARSSCCRRSCSSASGSSTRRSTRSSAASSGRSGFDDFVGIDNYKTLFTTSTLTTAIKNNLIWVAVVPAFVTAIGLIFAVLTERVALVGRVQDRSSSCRWRSPRSRPASPGGSCTCRTRTSARSTRSAASVVDVVQPAGRRSRTRCRRRRALTGHAADRAWC